MIVFFLFLQGVFWILSSAVDSYFSLSYDRWKPNACIAKLKCGQNQSEAGGREACFWGTQQCHGTIIRVIHIYSVRKLELKGIWRDRMHGCLLILGLWTWSVFDICDALWHDSMTCTLWVLKLSDFYGVYTFKVTC